MGNNHVKAKKYTLRELEDIAKRLHLEFSIVKQYYDDYELFTQKTGGEIPKEEMVRLLSKIIGDKYSKDIHKYATQLYKAFDRDDNGTLSFHEFLVGYYLLNSQDDRLRLKFVFRMYDMNKDEKLDKNEIKAFALAFSRASRANMDHLVSNDNFISTLISELDVDRNGFISENEFIEGLIRNPEYKKVLADSVLCLNERFTSIASEYR